MRVISSRTPEGEPGECPICGLPCWLEPSWPTNDAPCPQCGHFLWFATADSDASSLTISMLREFTALAIEVGTARLGPPSPAAIECASQVASYDEWLRFAEQVQVAAKWADVAALKVG
jgi:hypothetical protein